MVQDPSDASQFYIGTDYGFILHVARAKGGATGPRGFQSDFGSPFCVHIATLIVVLDVPSDVLCQAFSPFEPTILIVIFAQSSLALSVIPLRLGIAAETLPEKHVLPAHLCLHLQML